MRVEDAGSLSPAGDLLAFSIALVLTLGVLAGLGMETDKEKSNQTVNILEEISNWELIDHDGDGLIEMISNDDLDGANAISSTLETLKISMEAKEWSFVFLVIEGIPSQVESDLNVLSAVHSMVVLFESGDEVSFGTISICEVEVIT